MNCVIPGANLKIMNKVLQTLAKIGDELYIEAKEDHIQFATINLNKTAFCKFNFHSTFFTTFTKQSLDDRTLCKVYVKSVLNIFKSKNPKEKKVDLCRIQVDEKAPIIIFMLKYKHDMMIVHNLRLIDKELIDVSYDLNNLRNEISTNGKLLQQILNNFQNSDEDMSLEIKDNNIIIRNYDLNSTNNKGIRSQIALRSTEFCHYNIENESNITMCFKPFRAAAHFCEGFNLNVVLNFDSGGKPVILTITNPVFHASFILSTINPSGDTEPCASSTMIQEKETNLTVQDRDVIENINWDSDFELQDGKFETDRVNYENNEFEIDDRNDCNTDAIPNSPDSPRAKRLKLVFRQFLDPTFQHKQLKLGKLLVSNSDTE